jgi:hypothetical protein
MSIESHEIDKEDINEEEHIPTKNDVFNVKRKRSSDSQTIQELKNQIFMLKKKLKQAEGEKSDIFGDDEVLKVHTFTIKGPEGLLIRRKFVRRRGGDDKNFREKASISAADRLYLNKNQAQITENFLNKYANSELHVFEGMFDNILLLNIPFDFDNFEKFMTEYNNDYRKHGTGITGVSPRSTRRYETSSDFYLNSLKSIDQIKDFVQNVFNDYNRTVVKVQMKFVVVWEVRDDIVKDNVITNSAYRYYYNAVHEGSASKMPLLVVTPNTKENMNSYFLSMLKEITNKNGDGAESSHRVIGVTRLQITLYDCDLKLGAKLAADSIVHQLVRNLYAFTVNLQNLCWFGCMSYLKFPRLQGSTITSAQSILVSYF